MKKAISVGHKYVVVPIEHMKVLFQSRKSWLLVYHNKDPWIKKDDSVEFRVAMTSYDGAELCVKIGLFMLDKLSTEFDIVI